MKFTELEPINTQDINLKTRIKDKRDCTFINRIINNSDTKGVKALVKKFEVIDDRPGVRGFDFCGHAKTGLDDNQYLVGSPSKRLKLSAC
jgi:hypothetical protein